MKKMLFIGITFLFAASSAVFCQSFNKADQWVAYSDKDKGGTSVINTATTNETIDGKEYMVVSASGNVTTKYQYGFVGLSATPDAATLEFMKSAKGISFKTIGDGKKYRVCIETSDITDSDYYGKEFYASKGKAATVTLTYSSLSQEGWGAKKKFDASKIIKIHFQTIGQPIAAYSFKLFDLNAVK